MEKPPNASKYDKPISATPLCKRTGPLEHEQLEHVAHHIKALLQLDEDTSSLEAYAQEHPEVQTEQFLLEASAFAERVGISTSLQMAHRLLLRLDLLAQHLHSPHQVTTQLSLGRHQLLQGQLDGAETHFQRAQDLLSNQENTALQGNLWLEQASLALQREQFEKAYEWLQQAATFFGETNDSFGQSQALVIKGQALQREGNTQEAANTLMEALDLQQQFDDPITLANTMLYLAQVHQDLGQYSEAEDAYQKALPIYQGANDPRGLGKACLGLGQLYNYLQDHEGAEAGFQNALKLFQSIHARQDLIITLRALGDLYQTMGQEAAAEECQHQAQLLEQASTQTNTN